MSEALAASYVGRLHTEGLFDLASNQKDAAGEAGGESMNEADAHLAYRFTNSAGRNLCAVLDPNEALGAISNSILAPMLGERVLIVDVPCGAGAAGLSLLDCLKELRLAGALPKLPLSVRIVAGDISTRAIEHYQALVDAAKDSLLSVGISVDLVDFVWDVSDIQKNAIFVDQVVTSAADFQHVVVLASNFSDAMSDISLLEHFKHFLSQLVGRLAKWPTTVCWIEPKSNKAKKYLPKLKQFIEAILANMTAESPPLSDTFEMWDPVSHRTFRSGISILECRARLPE